VRRNKGMWGNIEIGAIYRRIRTHYLCFTYAPIFTNTLVFSCSERTDEGLVEVTSSCPCKVPKFHVNSLALSSSAVRPLFPTLTDITREKTGGKTVIIIGVTNRPDSLLRIAGRFAREFCLNMPDDVRREKHYYTPDYF